MCNPYITKCFLVSEYLFEFFVGHGHLKKLGLKCAVATILTFIYWKTRLRQASSQHLLLHSILYIVARLHIKIAKFTTVNNIVAGAQWLSGRVLDSRLRGRGFETHRRHCLVVLEQDTFILA